jgi:hypothetical protein
VPPSAAQMQSMQFGGGAAASVFNPVVLLVVLAAGVLICACKKRTALAAFLAPALLIPIDQILLIGPLHFPMYRLLALFGLVRIARDKLMRQEEVFSGGMNGLDKAVVFLTLCTAIDGVLLWRESGEFIYQLGNVYTAFGVYFLVRHLLQDYDDVKKALRVLAVVTAIVAGFMLYESTTGKNFFYDVLGGAVAHLYAEAIVRGNEFRATGPFGHPNLAGTFGGIMFPLFVGLWWWDKTSKTDRKFAVLGILGAAIIPFSTGSSTGLFGLLAGVGALCLWPMRRGMRLIRWGIVATLVGGQMCMTSPVWHIISDVSLSEGSSSYHRYQLVNQCIMHFGDWALLGSKFYGTWGWDMWDLSNQYVATADPSGLIPLICFLAIIVLGFRYIGKMRKAAEGDHSQELFVWALGASLFANVVAFFGISYFDQTIVAWYAILAIICVVTLPVRTVAGEAPAVAETGAPRLGFVAPAALVKPLTGIWAKSERPKPLFHGNATRGTRP